MRSMTGFGEGRVESPAGVARVVVATVNHKAVNVTVRGDLRDLALEEQLRDDVRRAIVRGSASVQIAWDPVASAAIDQARVAAVWRELAKLAAQIGAPPPQLADALSSGGRGRDDITIAAGPVREALVQAITRLDASRDREGAVLHSAFVALATRLRAVHGRLAPLAAARVPAYRERLAAVVADAVGRQVPPEVLAREVALEAQRLDISEELTRLAAHLDALDRLLKRSDPIGRELEFLTQELGREANTAGAKANDAALSALCIDLKVAIDQLKEQAANVV